VVLPDRDVVIRPCSVSALLPCLLTFVSKHTFLVRAMSEGLGGAFVGSCLACAANRLKLHCSQGGGRRYKPTGIHKMSQPSGLPCHCIAILLTLCVSVVLWARVTTLLW